MKHLFNDLDQNEKNRILEMHKTATKNNYLVSEQQKRDGENMFYGPNQKEEKEKTFNQLRREYLNKTVNFYSDEANKDLIKSNETIKDIEKKSEGEIEINLKGFKSMFSDIMYYCQKPKELKLDKAMTKKGDEILYNKNLTDKLYKDFCTKSSGQSDVPKADFASTNRPSGQNFA